MLESKRNPHVGCAFTDSDSAIEAALTDVSIPALLCSMVHVTGDPAWIRSKLRPHGLTLNQYQGGMTETEMTLTRRLALPVPATRPPPGRAGQERPAGAPRSGRTSRAAFNEPGTGQRPPPGIPGIKRNDRCFHRGSPGSPNVHVVTGRHRGPEQRCRCRYQPPRRPVPWQVSKNLPVLKLSAMLG